MATFYQNSGISRILLKKLRIQISFLSKSAEILGEIALLQYFLKTGIFAIWTRYCIEKNLSISLKFRSIINIPLQGKEAEEVRRSRSRNDLKTQRFGNQYQFILQFYQKNNVLSRKQI